MYNKKQLGFIRAAFSRNASKFEYSASKCTREEIVRYIIILCLLILTGCSSGGFESVSQVLPESKPIEKEIMEAQVEVYSTAGSTDGEVFLADERDKWIVTEATVMRDHPKALVVTSNGQQLEAKLKAFSIEENIAVLHLRNSADVKVVEQANQQQLLTMLDQKELTATERYTLHEAFKAVEVPQKYDMTVLNEYDKPTFEYNPDALQAFIHTFNEAYNTYLKTEDFSIIGDYVLGDLLKEVIQVEENKPAISNFEVTEISKTTYDWQLKGRADNFEVSYKIMLVNGQYYITYLKII